MDGPRLFVFIIGQLRSAEKTAAPFREHLADAGAARLVVQCGAGEKAKAEALYPEATVDTWNPPERLPWRVRWAWPLLGGRGRETARLKPSMLAQLARQYRAAELFGAEIDPARDWILKWRPDLLLLDRFDWRECAGRNAIWVPEHDNFGGINDQWALGPANLMLPYLRRLRRIADYFAEGGRIQAESYLKWTLMGTEVRRLVVPYCIHRGDRLQAVTMCEAFGDRRNETLAARLKAAGVPLVDPVASVDLDEPPFPRCGRHGHWWQRMLSLGMDGRGLAATLSGVGRESGG